MKQISETEYLIEGDLYTNDCIPQCWYKRGVTIRVKGILYLLGKESGKPEYLKPEDEWLDLYNFKNLPFKIHDVVSKDVYFMNFKDEKLSTIIYNFYIKIKNKIINYGKK